MKMIKKVSLGVCMLLSLCASAQDDWHLMWSEEFNVDGPLNSSVWNFEQGYARNEEAQWYQSDNATCKDGFLVIEARKEQNRKNPLYVAGSNDWRKKREFVEYTSSSVTTAGKKEFLYGRFEVRARIPVAKGAWPAIWALGSGMDWPSCGEIDIMEYYQIKGVPHILANAAWGTDRPWHAKWDSKAVPYSHFTDKDSDWASKFHVWRMDWDEEAIKIYLDDELLNEIPLENTVNGKIGKGTNPFTKPQYLLLNLAIGGINGGPIDEAALPMKYEIDYVRVYQKEKAIAPGKLWRDTDGNVVNAHGGGILCHKGTYYWFGEHRPSKGFTTEVGVTCYSSKDLMNWKYEGVALAVSEEQGNVIERGCIMERPKVIYNAKTGKYVMWFHLELKGRGYEAAQAAVAISDTPAGPYKLVGNGRVNRGKYPANMPKSDRKIKWDTEKYSEWWTPQWYKAIEKGMFVKRDMKGGQMSRDMTLFVDDDGKAYHIYSSEDNLTLHIARLADDYLSHSGEYIRIFPSGHNEAPAIFKKDGVYWMIASGCTGWKANKARLFTADSMMGEWKQLPNPCVGEGADITFNGQSTFVAYLPEKNQYVFMADNWRPENLADSRYIWLPVQFDKKGIPFIKWHDSWSPNLAAKKNSENIFMLKKADRKISPYTGMSRQHWVDAATYILDGAFSYIHTLDDPMKFPKQLDKTYPNNDGQLPVEKLEGLCRTLFVAAPLLRENPDMELNGIKVADYYRHQILNLTNPQSAEYIVPRAKNGGASQTLVEFGALAISLSITPDVLWNSFTQEQKDALAATMLSYGDGPTINSNWRFFNVFILSFFKDKGYKINEERLTENLDKILALYRGEGWYNDSPAYDYYSMWAFQLYGPLWAQLYGKKYYPEYADKFIANLAEVTDNYPYMFGSDGKMNMWGRSVCYRFGAIAPFPMLGLVDAPNVNYGWLRYISSSTLLQFIQNPNFLQDNVPTMGFYGPFAPVVQIYSCRGSVYWSGKAFFALLLPKDHPFWAAKENRGPWEKELRKGEVYNKLQSATGLLITDYPNSGAAEMRSWCHETVANDWQKFRSTENYNKLAYNTAFPWMADGAKGEISMNYAIKNQKNDWEVLRLYDFKKFEDEIYYRNAVIETNKNIKFQLADITLPDGILRVDKVTSPVATDIRLGHYSLPDIGKPIKTSVREIGDKKAYIINNGEYQLAMIPYEGWNDCEFVFASDLHPVSKQCAVSIVKNRLEAGKEKMLVTLMLWKKGTKPFTNKELMPLKALKTKSTDAVAVTLNNNTEKQVVWEMD